MRDYLALNCFPLRSDPRNINIIYGVLNCIFDSGTDKAYALQRPAESKAAIISALSSNVVNFHTTDHNDDRSRTVRHHASRAMTTLLAELAKT